MMDDHRYDVLAQLAEEQKSLWRIREMYESDSSTCPECQEIWSEMEEQKRQNVEKLEALLIRHLGTEAQRHEESISANSLSRSASRSAERSGKQAVLSRA